MVASVGAMSGTPTRWPIRPMPIRPTISPTTAEMIGIPMATMVPKARLRMIIATAIPTSSLLSVSGLESSDPIEPPTAMSVIPAARRGFEPMSRICLGLPGGQVGRADVQQHRDVRDPPVLRQLGGALLAEGARRAHHVRGLGQGAGRGVDRLLVARVAQLARIDREDDRVLAVLLGRKAVGQDVRRGLAAGSRQGEVVRGLRADHGDHGHQGDGGEDPRQQDGHVVPCDPSAQPIEGRRHAARPSR